MKHILSTSQLILSATLICNVPAVSAITINFDYSYDTSGFFTAERINIMQSASNTITSRINDNLTAINNGGSNQFNAIFSAPNGSGEATVNGVNVAADSLTIYVGAQAFGSGTLAQAGPGGYSYSGAIDPSRGQGDTTSPTATDFGPWGGSMSFNSSTNWYFDNDTSTTESFAGNDFYSVVLHELGHVLGIGTSSSWNNQIAGGLFTGGDSNALFGADVALNGAGHWADGVSYDGQQAAMTASILNGTRKEFTELDFAALSDIGWEITPVPVPPAVFLFASGLLGLVGFSRRRKN